MLFHSLRVEGFGSFNSAQEITFHGRAPGLYMLSGRNDVDLALGSNGSGKSTLWSALCWTLFGRTPRGLRAKAIRNWQADDKTPTRTQVMVDIDGKRYCIARQWKPNKLMLGQRTLSPITQEELEDVLRLDFSAFTASIITAQFGPFFLDFGPTQRASLFTALLQLDSWTDCARDARKLVKSIESEINALSQQERELYGKITGLEAENYAVYADQWNKDQAQQRRSLELDIEKAKQVKAYAAQQLRTIKADVKLLETRRENIKRRVNRLVENTEDLYSNVSDAASAVAVLKAKVSDISKDIDGVGHLKGKCPECHQIITENHKRALLKKLRSELSEIRLKLNSATTSANKREKELDKARNILKSARTKLEDVGYDEQKKLRELSSLELKKETAVENVLKFEHELTEMRHEVNPYHEKEKAQRKAVIATKAKRKVLLKSISEHKQRQEAANYWATVGFKDIQAQLTKTATKAFESEMVQCLDILGLEQWKVVANIKKERDTGPDKMGFFVDVASSEHDDDVAPAWESWSGGEGQRLRLAGTMALGSLILNSRGLSSNIEIYDEPCSYLSAKGIDDMLTLLADRARKLNKQIWITDHRSLESGDLAGEVTVVKTIKGSVIE